MSGISLHCAVQRAGFALEVSLELPGQGITALHGPSGAGKSSCLRVLAGLDRLPGARVVVNGLVWQSDQTFVPVHCRALGYVAQDTLLFPHLDVAGNLDYGYRRAGRPQTVDRAALVALLGIGALLTRRPQHLSGGERQRVAIARALMTAPQLLLLDEPLAGLDAARKTELLPYLEALHARLEIPMIYVSHVREEVLRLADHLVLIDQGRVQAQGPLQTLLARLDLPGELGRAPAVVFEATVLRHDAADGLTQLAFGRGGRLWVALRAEPVGAALRGRIEARDLSLALQRAEASSLLNLLPATVVGIADAAAPGQCLLQLDCHGVLLLCQITCRSQRALQLTLGTPVWAQIKAVALLR